MFKLDPWKDLASIFTGKWAWLGIASVLCSLTFIILTLTQFIKCLKTKNTSSMSLVFVILLPVTNTILLIYNIFLFVVYLQQDIFNWAILITTIFNGLISAYGTMIMKIKHMKAAKKLKLSEVEYYEKYLKPKAKATKL